MQASNNVAAILSQNIEYADRKGWIREMEQRANDLVKKVNPRCLAVQNNDPRKNRDIYKTLDRIQAAFFDTAAAVQSALSARETNQKEMRLRLCDAYKYANRAIGLQLRTLDKEEGEGAFSAADPDRVTFLDDWTARRQESAAFIKLADYDRMIDKINKQLAQLGYTNADCS